MVRRKNVVSRERNEFGIVERSQTLEYGRSCIIVTYRFITGYPPNECFKTTNILLHFTGGGLGILASAPT